LGFLFVKTVQIKANFSGNSRVEILEKRECYVFPVVMLAEGVHCGSGGCVFYPQEEIAKFTAAWDHKPVVVRHPMSDDGEPTSACTPKVANTTKVGTLFNTRLDNGKLKSEAWIFKDVCKSTFPPLWTALTSGEMQEISTGLFFDAEEASGVWGNESYSLVARNLRPDHLAILPDEEGAFSIRDGAGIPRLNKESAKVEKDDLIQKYADLARRRANQVGNTTSYNDLYSAVSGALDVLYGYSFWIEDLFLDSVVYGLNDKSGVFFKRPFTVGDPLSVELGSPTEVARVVSYSPTGNAETPVVKNMETKNMADSVKEPEAEKPPVVETPAAETPAPQKAEEAPQALSVADYVAKAPDAIKAELSEALSASNAKRAELVEVILANKANPFSKEELAQRPLADLNKLAVLASAKSDPEVEKPQANYAGVGSVTNSPKVEPLASPSMWEDKK
jgi:hypothetical protein